MTDLVAYLTDYRIVICKECKYAVLPIHWDQHLSGSKHRLLPSRRKAIRQEIIRSWPNLWQNPEDVRSLQIPRSIEEPFEYLPVFNDGFRCDYRGEDGERCGRIYRHIRGIQQHCEQEHGWVNDWRRGLKGRDRRRAGRSVERPWTTKVSCQRFFVQGLKQEYFEVGGADNQPSSTDDEASEWDLARVQLTQTWTGVREGRERTIQEGTRDEVNLWVERTGWHTYLIGLDRQDLLKSTSEPVPEEEPIVVAIDTIAEELIQYCQESVGGKKVGVFVRLEAIRSEKHQTRYQPLQPYMNTSTFRKYSQPWKQIIRFFARTQEEHEWGSPVYRFTRPQQKAWKALVREARQTVLDQAQREQNGIDDETDGDSERPLSQAQRVCLRFLISLLDQRISRSEYDSPLVCALAVLGVTDDGWMGVDQYPPILSAVIKTSRFIVVQQGLEGRAREEEEEGVSAGCLEHVQEMMDRFMVRGTHGPMQWMLDLRTYGLKIHYNTTSEGHIDWVGDQILYKQIQFTMAEFRGMVHGVIAASRRILEREVLFTDPVDLPPIPWLQLRDDPTNKRPGWNFVQDPRCRFPVDGEWWLFDRIGQAPKLRRAFRRSGPRFEWNRTRVEGWMAAIIEFRERLLVLFHWTGGQPGRAPEISSVRHSNTVQGEYRNIFVEDGTIVFACRYHKRYAIEGDVNVIQRYVPREVGALYVWYVWLVLPFQQKLEAILWGKREISSHVWPPDPNGRQWTSERMRKIIERESQAGMGVRLTIQAYREVAIGISRRYLQPPLTFRPEAEDHDADRDGEGPDDIWDLQAGQTSHVAGMVYARGIMEMDGVMASKRAKFRETSEAWRRFLGFESIVDRPGTTSQKRRVLFATDIDDARLDRLKRIRRADPEPGLRQIVGKEVEFRGIQGPAVQAIMRGESPVVAVIGTGGGKSVLLMLPAWYGEGGCSVVVVPSIALRQDLQRRCQSVGIRCDEWDRRRPPDAAQIVLVTPESAVGDDFRTFLNRLKAIRRLDRIVIDECHVVLNDQMDFRKQMQRLGELVGVGTQIILLTATLPPSQEGELWRRMDFERDEVKIFRASTRRRNIRYAILTITGGGEVKQRIEQIARFTRGKMEQYPEGKTVVYCNTVKGVRALAEELDCEGYHHHAGRQQAILDGFIRGGSRIIVATSAFGLGIDIPNIRVIIHADRPRTILDYAQESGRAGRDGSRSEAIIMEWRSGAGVAGEDDGAGVGSDEVGSEGTLTDEWMRCPVGQCRRKLFDRYLDGQDGRRCEKDEVRCDRCAGEPSEVEPDYPAAANPVGEDDIKEIRFQERQRAAMARRGATRIGREGLELEELQGFLRQARGKCASCTYHGVPDTQHALFWCPEASGTGARKVYEKMSKAIRAGRIMQAYSGCTGCFLPQEWCNRWERAEGTAGMYRRREGQGTCDFADVVLSGVVVGLYSGETQEGLEERMQQRGLEIDRWQEVSQYLGRKRVRGGLDGSELLREYYLGIRGRMLTEDHSGFQ